MPLALRVLVPHLPRVLRAIMLHVFCALRALVPCTLRARVFHVPHSQRTLVPYMLHC